MNSVIRTYIREFRRELEDEFTTSAIAVYRWYTGQPMPLLVARHISHSLGVPMRDFDTPIWEMICGGERPPSQATLDKIEALREESLRSSKNAPALQSSSAWVKWEPDSFPTQKELAFKYGYSLALVNWICGGKEKEDDQEA